MFARRPFRSFLLAALVLHATTSMSATVPTHDANERLGSLKQLSLEELTNLNVTAFSRSEERWWRMPGALDVITNEDIRRSGTLNLPDALRLATGVHVAQSSERSWAVGIRGFNVLAGNKVSVLMDGRSLYTPFFSGIQWDAQDTLLADIDRIEVARGPVGSLWGTYAVNGFIQIFTKPAWDTQGLLISIGSGTHDPIFASIRYGGRSGRDTFYRVYAKYFEADWTTDADGNEVLDSIDFFQTGFRVDALRTGDVSLTVQGDAYTNKHLPRSRLQTDIEGLNLLGRLNSYVSDGQFTAQGYLEYTSLDIPLNFSEVRRTASTSLQFHRMDGYHDWKVGLDAMISRDAIGQSTFVGLEPNRETFHNIGVFAQDTYAWRPDTLHTTTGVKLEHNFYTGIEWSPTLRAAWTPDERTTWWTAISRAVRTPVRLDRGLYARIDDVSLFEPAKDFGSEYVIAYEVGWRRRASHELAVDVSIFYNDYDQIRSNEPVGAAPFPLTFRNSLNARSAGGEITLIYQPTASVLLKGSYRYLDLKFGRGPDSGDISNAESEGNDPKHLVSLQAHLDLPMKFEIDGFFRHVSALPHPHTDDYSTVDLRVGWRPNDRFEASLTGSNLLEETHRELITTNSLNDWIPRSLTLKLTWRY